MKILVISTSVRKGRRSHGVALLVQKLIEKNTDTTVNLFDLKEANFPLFEERLNFMEDIPEAVQDFADKVKEADIIIPIIPEYNGSYPASFKNVFDLISGGWKGKVVGVITASNGRQGGAQCMQKAWTDFNKVGAIVIGNGVYVAEIGKNIDDDGSTSEDWITDSILKYVDRLKSYADKL